VRRADDDATTVHRRRAEAQPTSQHPAGRRGDLGAAQRTGSVYGGDVAVDGDLIAVGAAGTANRGNTTVLGRVYLFARVAGIWERLAVLRARDERRLVFTLPPRRSA
jgi:hypothetical protein